MENTSEEQGFDSYVITTTDPGPMFLMTIVGLSLMLFGVIFLVAQRSSLAPDSQHIDVDDMEVENQHFLSSKANFNEIESRNTSAYGATLSIDAEQTPTVKNQSSFSEGGVFCKEYVTHSPLTRHTSLGSFSSPTRRVSKGLFQQIIWFCHPELDDQQHLSTLRLSQQETTGGTSETFSVRSADEGGDDDDDDDDDNEVDYNVLEFCNSSTSTVQKLRLILCHNCDPISRSIYALSGPFLIQALIAAASEIIRLALVGHQLGTASLSSFVIVDLLVRLTSDVMGSIIISGNTMISQISEVSESTHERENAFKAGRYLQLSLILYVFGSLPFVVMWSLCMGKVLVFLGNDHETAEIGREFATWYALASLFGGLCFGLQYMLDVFGHEVESTILTAVAEVVTTVVVALFLYWKTLSLIGLGYVYLACNMLYLLTLWIVIQRHKWLIDYKEGLSLFQQQEPILLDFEVDDQERFSFSNSAAVSLILSKASLLAIATMVTH
jgi:hypothetical protein